MEAQRSPLVESFVAYLRYERRYSENTLTAYETDLAMLGRFLVPEAEHPLLALDDALLRQLDRNRLRAWLIHDPELSAATLRRRITTVRGLFRHAMRLGVVTANPAARLTLPKLPRRLAAFVPEAALTAVLESAAFPDGLPGLQHRLVLELIYGCGLRRSEAVALRWQDVQLAARQLQVQGKGRKQRLVPFAEPVASLLQAWREALAEAQIPLAPTVLQTELGQPLPGSQVYALVKRYLGRIPGLGKSSPHVLRHSYATHLVNRGADLSAVKELLGHASLGATQVYVHNSVERFKDLYRKAHPRASDS